MDTQPPPPPPGPDRRPVSDVSSAVGLVGLAGLIGWLIVCHNWAGIAAALNLPGPRAPLSGPYAAMLTVLFTGAPMALWSLLVEKVHRRPSTGIDWGLARPVSDVLDISIVKLAGLWATWAIIGFFYCVARWYWRDPYLFAMDVIGFAAIPMFALSIPYVIWLDRYLVEPRDGAWHFGAMLIGREAYSLEAIYAHFRSWAVKAFYCAFMISIVPGGFFYLVETDFSALAGNPVRIAITLIQLLFVIDVHLAMVGYLLTMRPLDAHIRSANPHLAGWVAALICYPPFILMGDGGPFSYMTNTAGHDAWAVWMQGHDALLWAWGALLVFLTAIYAWATMIYGLRFSNLTYRGVITNGPYRFTRHPAYLSKNLFWWCSALPFLTTTGSLTDIVRNTTLLAATNAVYYWRARTEERHLSAEDAKYRDYYAWMERHGPITRALGALTGRARRRGASAQPAE